MKPIAAFGLAAVGGLNIIFIIISMATSAWVVENGIGFSIWSNELHLVATFRRKLEAVRAFMLLALFEQIAAVAFCVLMGLQKTEKKIVAVFIFLVSGVFLMIALAVFTVLIIELRQLYLSFPSLALLFSYGASYILGWVAFVFSIVLAVAVEVLSRVPFAQQ